MSYEQKDLTGSLFRNARKEAETHADYNGSAKIGGVDHFVDAWINTAKDGSKYMSLKFKPKEARSQPAREYPAYSNQAAGLDDDVPF